MVHKHAAVCLAVYTTVQVKTGFAFICNGKQCVQEYDCRNNTTTRRRTGYLTKRNHQLTSTETCLTARPKKSSRLALSLYPALAPYISLGDCCSIVHIVKTSHTKRTYKI